MRRMLFIAVLLLDRPHKVIPDSDAAFVAQVVREPAPRRPLATSRLLDHGPFVKALPPCVEADALRSGRTMRIGWRRLGMVGDALVEFAQCRPFAIGQLHRLLCFCL